MTYQRKLLSLSLLVCILTVLYVLSFVFDSQRLATEKSKFAFLDEKAMGKVARIELSLASSSSFELIRLTRQNGLWFVLRDDSSFPANQHRVNDFLTALVTPATYPVRATTVASHISLGLSEEIATRVRIFDDAQNPMLDLLIGTQDLSGKSIYLRKTDSDTVFSGPDRFSSYLEGDPRSWFDLAVFSNGKGGTLSSESIQRVIVQGDTVLGEKNAKAGYAFIRDTSLGWVVEGHQNLVLNAEKVDAYIKSIVKTEAENFLKQTRGRTVTPWATVTLETGDGRSHRLVIGEELPGNRREATISDSTYIFSLSSWACSRLVTTLNAYLEPPGP